MPHFFILKEVKPMTAYLISLALLGLIALTMWEPPHGH